MMKYAGTRVSSKNKKNSTRSRETKLPRQAASMTRIQATKERGSRRARAPRSVSGNSSAVITIRNREMPSTPTDQWMPSCLAQVWSDTIW
jgi:hypothetical protein